MLFFIVLLAFAALASAQRVLFEGSGYRATVYYGVNDGDVCGTDNGGPFPNRWAVTSGINDGYPFCTSKIQAQAKTLTQYNTNRIVAMNANMMQNDREYWCGKEVQIFKDGKQIILDEGPFILMDGCAACMTASIIDVSAKAFTQMSGGKCGDNPEGFTVKVIDNDLSATLGDDARGPAKGASVYNPSGDAAAPAPAPAAAEQPSTVSSLAANPPATPAAQATGALAAEQPPIDTPPVAVKPAAAPAVTPALAAAPAAQQAEPPVADTCTYGKWRCDGLRLQICNRATAGFAWETIATCAAECSFTVSGSAVCQ
ncbi:hypothetical protein CC85DRAFT_284278 [Cutaneotrichosporon oleaginosum]|uniref:RlpA-like protein double-psi beta-barrel domain-containing protein n=1 Tax=Cutaneotrichosporon oleaginosum TaxID=879819 RepID=A0A0J0XRL4_9TREE|nr:uncharacterized protein CC85DRAFT_284278 [Cutaneotrichosporon oleaginosum]KLT43771.1 hypothetical protein CC85DRAFT_284278 [Cutaneotrichosporon oleaginosum]TXT05187.1 hypothetical protein COLE_06507 [Cutaneotrichosporon oleaginosum]